MTIKLKDFLYLLKSHRLMGANLPHLDLENQFLKQWELLDGGANYLRSYERNQENPGSRFFEPLIRIKADRLRAVDATRTEQLC